jgi:hypothetical protein
LLDRLRGGGGEHSDLGSRTTAAAGGGDGGGGEGGSWAETPSTPEYSALPGLPRLDLNLSLWETLRSP